MNSAHYIYTTKNMPTINLPIKNFDNYFINYHDCQINIIANISLPHKNCCMLKLIKVQLELIMLHPYT